MNKALQVPPERLLDSLQQVLGSFGNPYNQRIPNASTVFYSHLMWEYMYLLAFYKKGNDFVWKEHILPQMEQWVANQYVQEDICRGRQLVSKFIDRRVQLKEALKKQAELAAQQAEQINPIHEIIPSSFRIAERRKTDVIKVLFYMMKLGLFVDMQNKKVKERDFMMTLGKFFNDDFKLYAQANMKATNMDNYLMIFDDLRDLAEKKVLGKDTFIPSPD